MSTLDLRALKNLLSIAKPDIPKNQTAAFRLQVDSVSDDGCKVRGNIVSGSLVPGDILVSSLSGRSDRVTAISVRDIESPSATVEDSVTLTLPASIGASVGDLLAQEDCASEVADQFAAHVFWLDDSAMLP